MAVAVDVDPLGGQRGERRVERNRAHAHEVAGRDARLRLAVDDLRGGVDRDADRLPCELRVVLARPEHVDAHRVGGRRGDRAGEPVCVLRSCRLCREREREQRDDPDGERFVCHGRDPHPAA